MTYSTLFKCFDKDDSSSTMTVAPSTTSSNKKKHTNPLSRFIHHKSKDRDINDMCLSETTLSSLSHIGKAAYHVLQTKHEKHYGTLWNITENNQIMTVDRDAGEDTITTPNVTLTTFESTSTVYTSNDSDDDQEPSGATTTGADRKQQEQGQVVWYSPKNAFTPGAIIHNHDYDPPASFESDDILNHHDDWLPEQQAKIIAKTQQWCDILSLEAPNGYFLKCFQKALHDICQNRAALAASSPLQPQPVVIRILFGNIIGAPTDCNHIIQELTKDLPCKYQDVHKYIKLWVGSWRKDTSWNHSKIIAVDGKYLWTGGHNLYHGSYLGVDPVNDVSISFQGDIARDGHLFANRQWDYIVKKQSTKWGHFVDTCVPDRCDVPRRSRVTVSEFPQRQSTAGGDNIHYSNNNMAEFPPRYTFKSQNILLFQRQQEKGKRRKRDILKEKFHSSKDEDPSVAAVVITGDEINTKLNKDNNNNNNNNNNNEEIQPRDHPLSLPPSPSSSFVPILSIGRYGALLKKDRPSDDALVAMFDAAQNTIRLVLQDLGPPTVIPDAKLAIPGSTWPHLYIHAFAKAIWYRDVRIEMILSNPISTPKHVSSPLEAPYGYGWDCADVANQIVKAIMHIQQLEQQKEHTKMTKTKMDHGRDDSTNTSATFDIDLLRQRVQNNLRLCYVRNPKGETTYPDGSSLGVHSKHYMIDDTLCYIGSQNLYDCDLAEWGVCIDHFQTVQTIKSQYWDPMWSISYQGGNGDCDVDQVINSVLQ